MLSQRSVGVHSQSWWQGVPSCPACVAPPPRTRAAAWRCRGNPAPAPQGKPVFLLSSSTYCRAAETDAFLFPWKMLMFEATIPLKLLRLPCIPSHLVRCHVHYLLFEVSSSLPGPGNYKYLNEAFQELLALQWRSTTAFRLDLGNFLKTVESSGLIL